MNQRQYIRLEAEANPQGVRIVCPWCGGGSDEERCMQVWSATAYRCFRATCGRGQGSPLPTGRTPEKAPRIFDKPTRQLTVPMQADVIYKYGFCPLSLTYCDEMNRFIQPILSNSATVRGHVARSLIGDKPKTINYQIAQDEPFMHWPARVNVSPPLTTDIKDMRLKDAVELLTNAAIPTNSSSHT